MLVEQTLVNKVRQKGREIEEEVKEREGARGGIEERRGEDGRGAGKSSE